MPISQVLSPRAMEKQRFTRSSSNSNGSRFKHFNPMGMLTFTLRSFGITTGTMVQGFLVYRDCISALLLHKKGQAFSEKSSVRSRSATALICKDSSRLENWGSSKRAIWNPTFSEKMSFKRVSNASALSLSWRLYSITASYCFLKSTRLHLSLRTYLNINEKYSIN